ncbi:hypothetical protein RJ527_09040 [Thalassospiraceae bacterium LMO-SO8]|nr:hypothetical protein [Alphaproteobacteria bacterium LMO-S08]WND77876.1 hypothetical protein RJ527_09040 [Thalassospiraceae bacterium LMO-SO8]
MLGLFFGSSMGIAAFGNAWNAALPVGFVGGFTGILLGRAKVKSQVDKLGNLQQPVIGLPPGDWGQSDYRAFSEKYYFHPHAIIEKTGRDIAECLPNADPENPTGRYAIFAKAFNGKPRVHVANRRAKEISPDAEYDGDIFIGLLTRYIRVVAPTQGRK